MKGNEKNISEKDALTQKYNTGRLNLLVAVILTAVNIVLLITGSNTYFIFSIFIPYFIADLGWFMSGFYPEEYYEGLNMVFYDGSFAIIMVALALAICVLYLLAYLFSKDGKTGWLIMALTLFAVDTVLMLVITDDPLSSILDIVFHIWVGYYLISALLAAKKLKELPPETDPIIENLSNYTENNDAFGDDSFNYEDIDAAARAESTDNENTEG